MDRDKFLTEAMGECWHSLTAVNPFPRYECAKCGKESHWCCEEIRDFSLPDGFFKIWEWAIKQEWWVEFKNDHKKKTGRKHLICYSLHHVFEDLINPNTFADALYEYLKERGGNR